MAQLRTDYKDEILDVSVNTQRKYRQVDNGDGTISFVDVTEYSQQGDPFGAGDINAITGNLTADNGESFNFGYNSEKKEYGFWAKVEGADTFFPFSNAKKLYEALQYSGLVTEDMTFDEMCEVLAEEYPSIFYLYKDGVDNGKFYGYRGACEVALEDGGYQLPTVTKGTSLQARVSNGSYYVFGSVVTEDKYNLTARKVIKGEYNISFSQVTTDNGLQVFACQNISGTHFTAEAKKWIAGINSTTSSSGVFELDVSALSGEYYIGFTFGGNSVTATMNINNLRLE